MNRKRITFFLPLLHFIFFCSQHAYGEANTASESVPPPPPAMTLIGDLREVFVVALPQPPTVTSKKNEPKNLKEFFATIKKDLSQTGKKLNEFSKELSGKHRHSFEDPDFTPPKRPDWR